MYFTSALTLATLAATAYSHGLITSPTPRDVGPAGTEACGPVVMAIIESDKTSHVEGLPEASEQDSAYNPAECNLWLCKGLQYEDNVDNVMEYSRGETVHMDVYIRIPHLGTANVSIVDTASNSIVGEPLISWDHYADDALGMNQPESQTSFDFVIPEDLEDQCAEAGACVLQWYWYGDAAQQTYESCVDFTVPAMEKKVRSRHFRN
ncbi:hypothetical protein BDY21DRAFT_289012 [Lineolata rhizophorae]|uniref:Chitin-binding type-4 domain-containing protein n=1 Tax=Lineolata rhizophorae TaxID=578093 RepID=A0A6A6NUX1_9PEZI|nr:hypothetical protein BDY21DRAFT_289012 [Lineolata rhizophorae]